MPRLGRDINLEILRVEGYRKVRFSLFFTQKEELTLEQFCNKLWNATKFAMLKFDEDFIPLPSEKVLPLLLLPLQS